MERYGLVFWDFGLFEFLVSIVFTVEIRFSVTVINSSLLANRQANTFRKTELFGLWLRPLGVYVIELWQGWKNAISS